VLSARQKLGWKVPTILDISASSTGITTVAPPSEWKNNVTMQVFSDVVPANKSRYPGLQLMVNALPSDQKSGGFGGQPVNVSAFQWDAMMLLDQTISATHSLDAKVNQDWLQKQRSIDNPKTRADGDPRVHRRRP
jgi:hypothetical protein